MTLINMIGDVGSGKSLGCVVLCCKSINPVYANFHINIPDFTLLTPEMLYGLNSGSTIGLDEAYSWIEARCSGSKEMNMYLSYILFQSRKKSMSIITTDQLLETIDLRFRLMANYQIECEDIEGIAYKYRILRLSRYHNYRPTVIYLPYEKAEKYYELYDTCELIDPIDKNMLFNISQNKEETLDEINKIVDKLLKEAPAHKYSKGILKHYCIENSLPIKMHEHIYNALKAKELKLSFKKEDITQLVNL